jgi:hypothetical protein
MVLLLSKRLKLDPDVCYFLALFEYSYSKTIREPIIGIESNNATTIENFIAFAVSKFKIEPNKIIIEGNENKNDGKSKERVFFYNSKLKKLMLKELERKEKIFKYKNDYSSNYLKGIYDSCGAQNKKGMFINGLKADDAAIMERLGFHTNDIADKSYIINKNEFLKFIKYKNMQK